MDNKEFISYKQSQTLSEINYDGDYDYTYHATGEIWEQSKKDKKERFLPAPLKQQVFRWFRDKYDAHMYPTLIMPNAYMVRYGLWTSKVFSTCEEAENACIDKLIELAKQQDK